MKLTAILSLVAVATAIPYGIPTAAEARTALASLKAAPSGPATGYSLAQFGSVNMRTDKCNTQAIVLWRDAPDLAQVDAKCVLQTDGWTSAWDGLKYTYKQPTLVTVDPLVTPRNAWISGASAWTADKRNQFLNDLERPELWVVTKTLAGLKGDKAPDAWKPPLASAGCTYAISWVAVKSYWALTITPAEKTALTTMLARC